MRRGGYLHDMRPALYPPTVIRLFIAGALSLVTTVVTRAHAEPAITVYSVRPGDSLWRIARRHDVSVETICRASARARTQKIYPGDKLIIPARAGVTARAREHADSMLTNADASTRSLEVEGRQVPRSRSRRTVVEPSRQSQLSLGPTTWRKYASAPRQPGLVSLSSHGRKYNGMAKMGERHVSDETRRAFGRLLFNHRNGKEADIAGRLVRLIVQVSDTFGGRTINVISGYRETSVATGSRHLHGAACDLSIEGVPNLALFAFLSNLAHVGVGYYPNSSFVHLDVRATKAIWVDLAGPGEPPRYVDAKEYFTTGSIAPGDY